MSCPQAQLLGLGIGLGLGLGFDIAKISNLTANLQTTEPADKWICGQKLFSPIQLQITNYWQKKILRIFRYSLTNLVCVLSHCTLEMVNLWNNLDDESVTASSLNSFKINLSRLRKQSMGLFMDNFVRWPCIGCPFSLVGLVWWVVWWVNVM